jgi:hypothetical protein
VHQEQKPVSLHVTVASEAAVFQQATAVEQLRPRRAQATGGYGAFNGIQTTEQSSAIFEIYFIGLISRGQEGSQELQ